MLKELNNKCKFNLKSYQKIINRQVIRNPELRKEVNKFNSETNYKYTLKKERQGFRI